MANETYILGWPSGQTLYFIVRNSSGQVWYQTNEEFEDWGTSGRSENDYAIEMADKSGGMYAGDFPEDIPADTDVGYRTIIFQQAGSAPASGDKVIGGASIKWTGVAEAAEAIDETTATSICNWGLLKLGGAEEQETIDSIYDGTPLAIKCLILFPKVRDVVLESWPWNECREFADLGAELSGIEMANWEYVFNLPDGCVGVVAQIDEDDHTKKYGYEIRQGMLFTNDYSNTADDSAYIDYLKRITDTSKYKALLKEAMATKLAAELAPSVKPSETLRLKQEYELLVLPKAKALNQGEQYSDDEGSYSWLDARKS